MEEICIQLLCILFNLMINKFSKATTLKYFFTLVITNVIHIVFTLFTLKLYRIYLCKYNNYENKNASNMKCTIFNENVQLTGFF